MPQSNNAAANEVIYCDDGLAAGAANSVCVVIWRNSVTVPRFNVQSQALDSVIHKHGRASLLCIVEPGTEPPDDSLRKASIHMISSRQGVLDSVACVIEGTGFQAAVTRSVLSGMAFFLGSRRAPVELFAHARRAAVRTSTHSGVPQDLIVERIDQLRYALHHAGQGAAQTPSWQVSR